MNNKFLEGRTDCTIQIYNRYQVQVYEGKGGWDCTYRGSLVEPGTYYYHIIQKNGKSLKGTLEILKF